MGRGLGRKLERGAKGKEVYVAGAWESKLSDTVSSEIGKILRWVQGRGLRKQVYSLWPYRPLAQSVACTTTPHVKHCCNPTHIHLYCRHKARPPTYLITTLARVMQVQQ